MRYLLNAILLLSFFTLSQSTVAQSEPKAKYVFLFIGDGMGPAQVYSAEVFKSALNGNLGREPLTFSQFPVQSYCTNYSANSFTTCSSASATAIATGTKTKNSYIGVDADLNRLETIAEKAKKAGYKVGLLTTVGINHATPGGFYGHQKNRNMYYEIAKDLLTTEFDYVAGGGIISPNGKSGDETSIYTLLDESGFKVVNTAKNIENLKNGDKKIIAINPGHRKDETHWVVDNVKDALPLSEFVKKGIEVLDNPNGFFMMCEGGKIDYACHNNDLASSIYETLDFDKAVAVAVDFYNQHPDETLIIVTADHETGGLTLSSSFRYSIKPELLKYQKVSLDSFNVKVADWAELPVKPAFSAILDSIKADFGLGTSDLKLTDDEIAWLEESYSKDFLNNNVVNPNKHYMDVRAKGLGEKSVYLLDNKAGFHFSSGDHSALPVPIRALGQGADYFKGGIDNTDIPKIIERLMIK